MLNRWFYIIFICAALLLLGKNVFINTAFAIAESTDTQGSNAIAVHQLGEYADNVNVGMISLYNVRTTHLAFRDSASVSHVFNHDFIGGGFDFSNYHETWLAGILASRGTSDFPDRVGVACGADVHCAKVQKNKDIEFINFYNALEGLVVALGCDVVTVNFALSAVPDGESPWTLLCDYYAYEHDVMFALASGNENNRIAAPGDCYNSITTAGLILTDPVNQYDYRTVGCLSGQGFTQDGRRKPDISMPSQWQTMPTGNSDSAWLTWTSNQGETSFAIPHTAGEASLLYSAAGKTGLVDNKHVQVIKAAMINSTFPNINDKQNLNTNPTAAENTWQNQRGYGRGDCLRGYELIKSPRMIAGQTTANRKGWGYGNLSPGQQNTYKVNIPKNCRIVATLVWNRRVQWNDRDRNKIIGNRELAGYLANLDLEVYEPTNSVAIFSESINGLNVKDNVEKCDILATKSGVYTIKVKNKSTNGESACYGLAFEVLEPLKGDLGDVDYVVDVHDLERMLESWLIVDSEVNLAGGLRVDFADFAELMDRWLNYDPKYYPH